MAAPSSSRIARYAASNAESSPATRWISAPASTSARTTGGASRSSSSSTTTSSPSATSAPSHGRQRPHHLHELLRLPGHPDRQPVPHHLPLQLARRAQAQDPASEHGHPVAEPPSLVQVVGAEEDRAAGVSQIADERPHVARRLRIEAAGRLVQEDGDRLVQHRPRDRELLLHALREACHLVVPALPEPEQIEAGPDPLAPLLRRQAVQPGVKVEVRRRPTSARTVRAPRSAARSASARRSRPPRDRRRRSRPARSSARSSRPASGWWWSCRPRSAPGSRRSPPARPPRRGRERPSARRTACRAPRRGSQKRSPPIESFTRELLPATDQGVQSFPILAARR